MKRADACQNRAVLELERLRADPLQRGLAGLVEASLDAEAGRSEEALDALDRALADGCRYRRDWLEGSHRLTSLHQLPRFQDIVRRADLRYAEDAAAARTHLVFALPDDLPDAFGYPLLVALHGNNANARVTAPQWSTLADARWVVAVPQSSEIGPTPDAYTWNDRERTAEEVTTHIERVKRATQVDIGRLVLGGFSMGGSQAIALALTRRVKVRGVILIAAWMPPGDELRELVEGGAGKVLRVYLVVGDRDPSYARTQELFEVLTRHGVRAQIDVRAGLGHEYPADMADTLSRAAAFVTAP
jgi:predicted esterase